MSTRSKTASALTSLGIVVLGWHQFVGVSTSSATSAPTVTVTATATPSSDSTSSTTGGTSNTSSSTATTAAASSATSSAAASGYKDGTYTGTTETFQYGSLSVTVTISDGKITKVTENLVEDGSGRTQQIDSYAVPELRQEVLSAQSSSISMISGATFTSSAYQSSLQSALDQA